MPRRPTLVIYACSLLAACKAAPFAGDSRGETASGTAIAHAAPNPTATSANPSSRPAAVTIPRKLELKEHAMGTSVTLVAFTSASHDEAALKGAFSSALAEVRRLEDLLSEWKPDTEIGALNRSAGEWVRVSPETLEVLDRGLWAGGLSEGTFDITFQAMSDVWKFGSASDATPVVPSAAAVAARRKLVDYRKVELDRAGGRARIGKGQAVGLGGIAKGYIVDRAARVLKRAGLTSFLLRAGGDLYGAGRKPDGSRWVSGIQDPRARTDDFFALLELEDHAFSTAGDYARSYVVGGKRYHHIIDPRTGYPATACRSVTVWSKDAVTADAVDDAVFILGPERGLALVETLDGVGAVIVDAQNKVHISPRLAGKVKIVHAPTDGI
jgi:thiamine biosynthesis lipoprotein